MRRIGCLAPAIAALFVGGCVREQAAPSPPDVGQPPSAASESQAGAPAPRRLAPAASQPTTQASQPATRPSPRVVFEDTFSQGSLSPERWRVNNPAGQRVVVQSGALVVRSEARGRPTRVEFQVQDPMPALGKWRLEFDALVNSLWGRGQGEVRVELRDYATRAEPEGTDFVLAERHWDVESGLKFGVFRDGAFVGWHEVAPVGQLGAWHHYRVDYDGGMLTLWRDGERALDCNMAALLERPLVEGVAIEMGFHVPQESGIEGCIDNVTLIAQDGD